MIHRSHVDVWRIAVVLVPMCLLSYLALPMAAATRLEPQLDGFYERWLQGVRPWISEVERRYFLRLPGDQERELFIRRFWEVRDPPLLRDWRQRFEAAHHLFGDMAGDRAQAMLAAGLPVDTRRLWGCPETLRQLEVWTYGSSLSPSSGSGPSYLLFYRKEGRQGGDYRLWKPEEGGAPLLLGYMEPGWPVEALLERIRSQRCFRADPEGQRLVEKVLRSALGPEQMASRGAPPDPEWLVDLALELSGSGAASGLPDSRLEIIYPGLYLGKTVVEGTVRLPSSAVGRNARDELFDRLVIRGDILARGRLVDAFEIIHYLAGPVPNGDRIELTFHRRLRPGAYQLDLRVEDSLGLSLLRDTRPLEVPNTVGDAEPPAGYRQGFAELTRSEVGLLTTFPSVELRLPAEGLLAGEVEVEAVTSGGPVARLDFLLDGALVTRDGEPPWTATLHLGTSPGSRRVAAVASDAAGRELARAETLVDPGSRPFAVHLVEPRRGEAATRAVIEVDVPRGAALDRVELFLDEARLAVFEAPPFVWPLAATARETHVLRAVAWLASGESLEDTFLISPDPIDEIDVRLVELYTSVNDPRGRPATGLGAADFTVYEDGQGQPIVRFDTVESRAIHVALLMDTSSSMRRKVHVAAQSARAFFSQVLTAKDSASLLTFNHDIRQQVSFTADAEQLRRGTYGVRAWGTTRLHDSIVWSLHAFGGLAGKRALVLLSDGRDVGSDFDFAQVLRLALRSGVAVYPIVLDVEDPETLAHLRTLADETGGRYFEIEHVGGLRQVYQRIEQDLRFQYLLVYRSPAGGREFRRVRVAAGEGLKARTISGYFP